MKSREDDDKCIKCNQKEKEFGNLRCFYCLDEINDIICTNCKDREREVNSDLCAICLINPYSIICPKCKLNEVRNGENYCENCLPQLNAIYCPKCKCLNQIVVAGETLCSTCLKDYFCIYCNDFYHTIAEFKCHIILCYGSKLNSLYEQGYLSKKYSIEKIKDCLICPLCEDRVEVINFQAHFETCFTKLYPDLSLRYNLEVITTECLLCQINIPNSVFNEHNMTYHQKPIIESTSVETSSTMKKFLAKDFNEEINSYKFFNKCVCPICFDDLQNIDQEEHMLKCSSQNIEEQIELAKAESLKLYEETQRRNNIDYLLKR